MKIHLLGGFLGSGKTTALQQAAQVLIQQGIPTGIITNDQGTKLVDGALFANLGIPGREVVNGCFCCNYNEFDASIASLIENDKTQIIFAESVGSCTDIVATVVKPLLQFRPDAQVTVSILADIRLLQMMLTTGASPFEETVRYIYLKQLEEAGIIVINKIDLMNDEQVSALKLVMHEKYSGKVLLYQNALDKNCIQRWLQLLDGYTIAYALPSVDINYDAYAAGEAMLAWVDQSVEIFSASNNALQQAQDLVNKIYEEVLKRQYAIGHLKFLINQSIKVSFTAPTDPTIFIQSAPAGTAIILINMRVQAPPQILTQLVAGAIKEIELQSGCTMVVTSLSAFQPGYPRPVHRM